MTPVGAVIVIISIMILSTLTISLVYYRLGPGGYTATDAARDRANLCAALNTRFPERPFACPGIWAPEKR